ncbi:MAG TPA: hypothetical protein VFY43_08960 [Candidatus Limnocylindria bacterium]|nr:hypothetical protein [Candidatus Limnocylindria bacterium]
MPDPRRAAAPALLALVVSGCLLASPSPSVSPPASVPPSSTPPATTPGQSTASGEPTATPEPPLSLAVPRKHDRRQVAVRVEPDVPGTGVGEIVVTVRNLTERRVGELVLRWNTGLDHVLFPAPFRPSQQRIANGGPPLVQDWTKWVRGPGESGEPAGTTSLGWGPLLPGGVLTIPIQVTREERGGVSFDLQVLAGEAILALGDGSPAELRVSVP